MILSVGLSVGVFLYDETLSAQCSRVGLLFGCCFFFFLSFCFVILPSLLHSCHALNGVLFRCLHPLPMVVGPQPDVVSRTDRKNLPLHSWFWGFCCWFPAARKVLYVCECACAPLFVCVQCVCVRCGSTVRFFFPCFFHPSDLVLSLQQLLKWSSAVTGGHFWL